MNTESVLIHRSTIGNSLQALTLATMRMSEMSVPDAFEAGVISGRFQVLSEVALVVGIELELLRDLAAELAGDGSELGFDARQETHHGLPLTANSQKQTARRDSASGGDTRVCATACRRVLARFLLFLRPRPGVTDAAQRLAEPG